MRSWSRTFSIVRMHTVANSDSTTAVLSGSGASRRQREILAILPYV